MYTAGFIQVLKISSSLGDVMVFFWLGCLKSKRYSLCPHCAYSYRLTSTPKQTHAARATAASTTRTAPTATANVTWPCGVHRTQWGDRHWNHTTSTLSTSLSQVHHHPYLHHLTWESILLSVVDCSGHV